MHAKMLIDFFEGKVSEGELDADLRDTWERNGLDSFSLIMTDLDADYDVSVQNLVKICEAVLAGELHSESLEAIGFGMIASQHFRWDTESPDGELVAETLHDWASPEINYRLDEGTVNKFRHRLLTGESTFDKKDTAPIKKQRTTSWKSNESKAAT